MMITRILSGTVTAEDLDAARSYSFEERRTLVDRLVKTLNSCFEDALLNGSVLEDTANALKQARPVFAAGLSVDQALGFILKLVDESMENLLEAGEGESDEYEKQELVKDTLERFIEACNEAGTTEGEAALETVHLEYRGESAKLETQTAATESKIANTIAFLKEAYPDGNELTAFLKAFDRDITAARYIGKFGSPSFFACKHVGTPGDAYGSPDGDSEED